MIQPTNALLLGTILLVLLRQRPSQRQTILDKQNSRHRLEIELFLVVLVVSNVLPLWIHKVGPSNHLCLAQRPMGVRTPQVVSVIRHEDSNKDVINDIEKLQEEPTQADHTLLGEASLSSSALQWAQQRKKHFDKLFSHRHQQTSTSSVRAWRGRLPDAPNKQNSPFD